MTRFRIKGEAVTTIWPSHTKPRSDWRWAACLLFPELFRKAEKKQPEDEGFCEAVMSKEKWALMDSPAQARNPGSPQACPATPVPAATTPWRKHPG